MQGMKAESQPSISRLILVPAVITTAVTIVRLAGELNHWSSAWFTTDDDSGPGVPFVLDGTTFQHRRRYEIPGTVAIHRSATSLTAAHELSHALSLHGCSSRDS